MKGQMKRIVAVMLSIMMVFTLVPLSSVNAASKAKLNKKSATIYDGKTVQLKVNNNKKKVKWSTSNNELLRKDADNLLQIRCKELKYIVASRYSTVTSEIYNGYKALEKYFEEISKFYSPVC